MVLKRKRDTEHRRPRWSQSTRENVLLRCCFQCTWPGCTRLAADLHHVEMRSRGGSDSADNLVGLCKPCHQLIHRETKSLIDVDGHGRMLPIDAARYWLAQQLETCHVRLDPLCRSTLFAEVESASKSIDNMHHHSEAIAQSGLWSNYDVFLKACWRYLRETARSESTVGAVVLLKMVQLYRRRPSRAFQQAAARHLAALQALIDGSSGGIQWLLGSTTYEQAYMAFLLSAPSIQTERAFDTSVGFEVKYGRPVGQLVSQAQGQVSAIRRQAGAGANLKPYVTELLRVQDRLAHIDGPLAHSWLNENIPIHLAYVGLLNERYVDVLDSLRDFIDRKHTNALWYAGAAHLRGGERSDAVMVLEEARRSFYRENRFEGRSGVLVTLGDAYQLDRRPEDARRVYEEAIKQAPHMDNASAIAVAKRRLTERVREPGETYLP